METGKLFHVLDSTDSTNNYAMAQVHAGLATSGMAWFAREQRAGKGQRGKVWKAAPGENIILSLAWQPDEDCKTSPFLLSARVALVCRALVEKELGCPVQIKWPNDIYIGDRKAGGILIENQLQGKNWSWAIIGIGINVNQTQFSPDLPNPASMKSISGQTYQPEALARDLHRELLIHLMESVKSPMLTMKEFNDHLYRKDDMVRLKKGTQVFLTQVIGVDIHGKLLCRDALEREFSVGEVEFLNME